MTRSYGRMFHSMTEAVRSNSLTPSTTRGSSGWPPRASTGARYETVVGSTAAMSCIASPGVSRVMIMPGGMIRPPTSAAPSERLAYEAEKASAIERTTTETRVIEASCGRVARNAPSAGPPSIPSIVPISGGWSAPRGRSADGPPPCSCFMRRPGGSDQQSSARVLPGLSGRPCPAPAGSPCRV